MPERSTSQGPDGLSGPELRVPRQHHVSHYVPDLEDAERWIERVFARKGIPIAEILDRSGSSADISRDYSTYILISDTFFDVVNPTRMIIGGAQRAQTVERPYLRSVSWYIDGMPELYRELKLRGIRVMNTAGTILEGDEPPVGADGQLMPFHSIRKDIGMLYQFFPADMSFPDPRREPGWVVPPVSDSDPLGIACCSHHTILTDSPERALTLVVDVLGGAVIHEGRDELRGTSSIYVHLGGSTYEYAIPDSGTPAYDDWAREPGRDTYYAISWRVADLDRVEGHLASEGVVIQARSDDSIVTDGTTSLGIPWGFSAGLIPGDPRGSY
jgi:catechol 2,3-dioxygenase-like lactoylglutathione lyase family enzyme